MSSDYQMNFYLKVNKNIDAEEIAFWQKALIASVDDPYNIEGNENELTLIEDYDEIDVGTEEKSETFSDGIETELCYRTSQTLKCFYQEFVSDVKKALALFAKNRNTRIAMTVCIWFEDRGPDDVIENTWEDFETDNS